MRHPYARLSTTALMLAGLIMIESCAREPAPGEVMLQISSNLSVPTDVDTLRVTVTHSGQDAPFSEQCYWLREFAPGTTPSCQAASLPGTVALVSNDGAGGWLQVHVELRRGGAKGAVRVQRDAELQVPSEGVKQLPMLLDILCLESYLPASCARGTTCRLGKCYLDKIDQLADYVATPAADTCFNLPACFPLKSSGTSALYEDDQNRCLVRGTGTPDDVNVALVVNPAIAGSVGVCDSGKCLIPVDKGLDGWTTITDSNGIAAGIRLPSAVCDAVAAKIVLGVVVSPHAQCGVKNASMPLCPAPATCVAAGVSCPEKWSGFSCTGGTIPTSSEDTCGLVQADPVTGPVVPGLWCCGSGRPAHDQPLLIDDMSSGPLIKLAPEEGYLAGGWSTFCDDPNAPISPPPSVLFSYRTFDPALVPAARASPISHAACLRSDHGFSGSHAGEGFDFLRDPQTQDAVPLDVSRYSGIRFWAYAAPRKLDLPTQIRVAFKNTALDPSIELSDSPFAELLTLPADGTWAAYTIKWADLKLGETEFDTNVYNVAFEIEGPGQDTRSLPFDFCVAQLEFTKD